MSEPDSDASPRVLLWDIESAPIKGYTWGAWEQNLLWKEHDWYILTIAWKWLGEKKVHCLGLDDFELYEEDPEDDFALVKHAWDLMDQADVIVGHNGIAFDTKKTKARMIIHGLEPPSPMIEVDTLKLARQHFAFTRNRLNDVCEDLGIGKKESTGGLDLWRTIVETGDPKAWAKMKRYNRKDVELLEALYLRLRPWAKNHPNMATISDRPKACPRCGSEKGMIVRGHRYTATLTYVQYQCKSCSAYCRGRLAEKKPVKTQMVN